MDIEERCNKVVALQSGIFKLIRENDNKRYICEQKLNRLKEKFNQIKSCYNEQVRKVERYDLEYIFLFEQYNLNRMDLESQLTKNNLYDQRLKKLTEHINNRKVGRNLDIKRTLYEFNGIVQKELCTDYELKIQLLKQKKIMSDKFEKYLECLKKTSPEEYMQKVSLAYSKEDKERIDIDKEQLKNEQRVAINVLKEKFDVSDDIIMSMDLATPNIGSVAEKMYSNLKDKLLLVRENSREIVLNNNEEAETNNRKSRAM